MIGAAFGCIQQAESIFGNIMNAIAVDLLFDVVGVMFFDLTV